MVWTITVTAQNRSRFWGAERVLAVSVIRSYHIVSKLAVYVLSRPPLWGRNCSPKFINGRLSCVRVAACGTRPKRYASGVIALAEPLRLVNSPGWRLRFFSIQPPQILSGHSRVESLYHQNPACDHWDYVVPVVRGFCPAVVVDLVATCLIFALITFQSPLFPLTLCIPIKKFQYNSKCICFSSNYQTKCCVTHLVRLAWPDTSLTVPFKIRFLSIGQFSLNEVCFLYLCSI